MTTKRRRHLNPVIIDLINLFVACSGLGFGGVIAFYLLFYLIVIVL